MQIFYVGIAVLFLLVLLLGVLVFVVFTYFKREQQMNLQNLRELLGSGQQASLQKTLEFLGSLQGKQREELVSTSKLTTERVREVFDSLKQQLGEFKKHHQEAAETRDKQLTGNISALSERVDKQLSQTIEKLGEFKELSKGVDSLTKVLSSVKRRGSFGENQLESIIMDLVPSAYYQKEYALKDQRVRGVKVDFVIQLPTNDDVSTLLPIDSKYPNEAYERLLAARERGERDEERLFLKKLQSFFKDAAKDMKKKYIVPPETTDFAILFIPNEGLFWEIYQQEAFITELRKSYQVILTGPNHFYALLHMLQMGYAKLAIEQRSQELWQQLEGLKKGMGDITAALAKLTAKTATLYKDTQGVHRHSEQLRSHLVVLEQPADAQPAEPSTPPRPVAAALSASAEDDEPIMPVTEQQGKAETATGDEELQAPAAQQSGDQLF